MPAASRVPTEGVPPNTKGRSSLRPSRRSKNGTGSSARSFTTASGVTVNCSELRLLTFSHRLE